MAAGERSPYTFTPWLRIKMSAVANPWMSSSSFPICHGITFTPDSKTACGEVVQAMTLAPFSSNTPMRDCPKAPDAPVIAMVLLRNGIIQRRWMVVESAKLHLSHYHTTIYINYLPSNIGSRPIGSQKTSQPRHLFCLTKPV